MNSSVRTTGRVVWAALRALLALTVLTGVLYPLAVTGVAQAAFHDQANGSIVEADGQETGSELIGQTWNGRNGEPDPKWFQGRPSESGYDPRETGSGQLGASDPTLLASVRAAKRQVADFNGAPAAQVPPDAVTGTASALDPHISPKYARLQTARVAKANGLPKARVEQVVRDHTERRDLGFLGQPRVNVLKLNLAVRSLGAGSAGP